MSIPGSKTSESLLEFYSLGKRECSVSFPADHGFIFRANQLSEAIYAHSALGGIEWNIEENKIVYIAESKKPENTSLFDFMKKPELDNNYNPPKQYKKKDQKQDENPKAKKDGDQETKNAQRKADIKAETPCEKAELIDGDKFLWEQDWGETLVGVLNPRPFVLDIKSGKTEPIPNLPKGYSFGTPAFLKGCRAHLKTSFISKQTAESFSLATKPSPTAGGSTPTTRASPTSS